MNKLALDPKAREIIWKKTENFVGLKEAENIEKIIRKNNIHNKNVVCL